MKTCFVEKHTTNNNTFKSRPHSHAYYELYILVRGTRRFFIGEEYYELGPNNLLLVPTNVFHGTEGEAYTRYLLNFTKEYLTEEQMTTVEALQLKKVPLTHEETNRLVDVLEGIYATQADFVKMDEKKNEQDRQTCFSYFFYLLTKLESFTTVKMATPPPHNQLIA